jgi:transcriptional regulator with XRE-family HTH domain
MEPPRPGGAPAAGEAKTVTEVVAANVRRLRHGLRMSGADLAHEMQLRGIGWNRTTVAKLETGRRESVTVQELLGLAVTLDVPPIWLLADPTSGYPTSVTGGVELDPWSMLLWAAGRQPLEEPGGAHWQEASAPLTWACQVAAIAQQMADNLRHRAFGFQ